MKVIHCKVTYILHSYTLSNCGLTVAFIGVTMVSKKKIQGSLNNFHPYL